MFTYPRYNAYETIIHPNWKKASMPTIPRQIIHMRRGTIYTGIKLKIASLEVGETHSEKSDNPESLRVSLYRFAKKCRIKLRIIVVENKMYITREE